MAPRTTDPPKDETAGVVPAAPLTHPTPPVQLAAVAVTGAEFGPVRVTRVKLWLADGREVTADLPAPLVEKDWAATKAGSAIIEVLASAGRPLKGSAIAVNAKYPYNGSFRSALAGLVKQGVLYHAEDDGYELVG